MRAIVALAMMVTLLGLPDSSRANSAGDAQWNAAYQQLLKNPSDVKTNKNYIALSIARGDYESAIPPLERLSMQAPNDAGYVLQIGEMYAKLDSTAVAKSYFEQVLKHPNATAAQKAQAQQYLK